MFVTAEVFFVLALLATCAMLTFLVMVVLLAAAEKGGRVIDRRLRKLPAEQYVQLVALPLCAALVGGLISTAIPILVAYPPWTHNSKAMLGYILITIALLAGVAGPLGIRALYADPRSLLIGERIERLKEGDWALDDQVGVLTTIDRNIAAIDRKLNSGGTWFLALILLVFAADVGWLVLDYVEIDASPVIFTLVMAAGLLGGLMGRYWLRPMSRRSALTDLRSYRAEAVTLRPPYVIHSLPRGVAPLYRRHLHAAVGGILIGIVVARIGFGRDRRDIQR